MNSFTIDVEDYWSIFSRDWLGINMEPSQAVLKNTEWFLEIFEQFDVKATFFILGEVAAKFPALIRKIARAGHEIGSHGISHRQLFKLTQRQFRTEISDSKKLLENIISSAVVGFRAPAFSIMPQTQWALEVLAEEGYTYDSSIYPISGRRYGWPKFSQDICRINLPCGSSIIEVPMSTITVLGKTLPVAGGGYIRHFPYIITKWAIKRIQKKRPVIIYMHPYEIDIEPLLFETKYLPCKFRKSAMRWHKIQMRNRKTVNGKFMKLLSEFEFVPIAELIENQAVETCKIV